MPELKIKVCGMRDRMNIQDVSSLMPDYMGFIFYKGSPRFVGNDFQISDKFPTAVSKVGVFVNEQLNSIIDKVKQHNLDFVQLHGDESVEFCENLNSNKVSVIKVFRVDDEFDFAETRKFAGTAEYFLFDTKGKNYGGNARKFDWNILKQYDQSVPFFLSGGIDKTNFDQVLKLTDLNLHALDVNSGAEHAPGMKDIKKVSAIITRLRV